MEFIIKHLIPLTTFLTLTTIVPGYALSVPEDFMEYHIKAAINEIEDEDIFYLIQENINNLRFQDISNESANELINLIEEGYTIDSFNMEKLIEMICYSDASNLATNVIMKAIEYKATITTDHLLTLIEYLKFVDRTNNATKVIIHAIEHHVKFGAKERRALTEASKFSTARNNVEKIRKALHEREIKTAM